MFIQNLILLGIILLIIGLKSFVIQFLHFENLDTIGYVTVIDNQLIQYQSLIGNIFFKIFYSFDIDKKTIVLKDYKERYFRKKIGQLVKISYDSKNLNNWKFGTLSSNLIFPIIEILSAIIILFSCQFFV